jgi:hypothetical protein
MSGQGRTLDKVELSLSAATTREGTAGFEPRRSPPTDDARTAVLGPASECLLRSDSSGEEEAIRSRVWAEAKPR